MLSLLGSDQDGDAEAGEHTGLRWVDTDRAEQQRKSILTALVHPPLNLSCEAIGSGQGPDGGFRLVANPPGCCQLRDLGQVDAIPLVEGRLREPPTLLLPVA